MALRDVQKLFRYWDRQPPVHELVAAYLGIRDDGQQRHAILSDSDLHQLAILNEKWGGLALG